MVTKNTCALILVSIALLGLLSPASAKAQGKQIEEVSSSIAVLNEVMGIPENSIPDWLRQEAYGIAIFPGVLKAGFILGVRYGTGILVVRHQDDRSWSNPVFFRIMGGGIGWQIGAESTDIVLVFRTVRSLDTIASGKFTLGADAAVAAGPVGRQAEANTDLQLKAEILSYSRSRGLFAGISVEGASMQVDYDATSSFYNMAGLLPMQVLTAREMQAPPSVGDLKRTLAGYFR